jgi:GxxExxY protein
MNTESEKVRHKAVTEDIIGAFYAVYNKLGYGFLEKVYENAMIIELEKRGIPVVQQAP